MQPEIQLLSELQPLISEQMGLVLAFPCHEDGGELEPFVWQSGWPQGELSAWNLLQSQGWVRSVDLGAVLQLWQVPEAGAVNGEKFLIPEGDPEGVLLDEQAHTDRAAVYSQLGQLLAAGLQNLESYELGCDSDYRLGLVVGQVADSGVWLGVGTTVPIATPASPSPLQTVELPPEPPDDPAYPEPTDAGTGHEVTSETTSQPGEAGIALQIQTLLGQLAPLKIYGYYGGGYNQTHEHQLVQVTAASPEQVLDALLRQVGLFRLSRFEAFIPTAISTASGTDQQTLEQFGALTAVLHRSFPELWVYRFSFWTWEQVFILGKQAEAWGGVVLRSHFTYNP